jgi:hypothetical protein
MESKTGGELAAKIGLAIRRVRQSKIISLDKLATLCEIETASFSLETVFEPAKINAAWKQTGSVYLNLTL